MKKLFFTVALLVAIIIPSLAFFDKNKNETKIINSTPTKVTKLSSDKVNNLQFTNDNFYMNSVLINDTDDGWENSDGLDMEIEMELDFRECG